MTELFARKNSCSSDNTVDWDDTELIKAYDLAISNSKQKIRERLRIKNQENEDLRSDVDSNKEKLNSITVGTPCRAVYDADNIEYEATVIQAEDGQKVLIKYVGYGNTQIVDISDLKSSNGLQARIEQERQALECEENENQDMEMGCAPKRTSRDSRNSWSKVPRLTSPPMTEINTFGEMSFPPPPPLPPSFSKGMKSEEQEALNAMLMSWYMSGYYTGFYQGLKKSKK